MVSIAITVACIVCGFRHNAVRGVDEAIKQTNQYDPRNLHQKHQLVLSVIHNEKCAPFLVQAVLLSGFYSILYDNNKKTRRKNHNETNPLEIDRGKFITLLISLNLISLKCISI